MWPILRSHGVVTETDPKMIQILGSVDKDLKIPRKMCLQSFKKYCHSEKVGTLSREMEPNENCVIKM